MSTHCRQPHNVATHASLPPACLLLRLKLIRVTPISTIGNRLPRPTSHAAAMFVLVVALLAFRRVSAIQARQFSNAEVVSLSAAFSILRSAHSLSSPTPTATDRSM